jgi:hypothetical protein
LTSLSELAYLLVDGQPGIPLREFEFSTELLPPNAPRRSALRFRRNDVFHSHHSVVKFVHLVPKPCGSMLQGEFAERVERAKPPRLSDCPRPRPGRADVASTSCRASNPTEPCVRRVVSLRDRRARDQHPHLRAPPPSGRAHAQTGGRWGGETSAAILPSGMR